MNVDVCATAYTIGKLFVTQSRRFLGNVDYVNVMFAMAWQVYDFVRCSNPFTWFFNSLTESRLTEL
jgi:hypothetical protein